MILSRLSTAFALLCVPLCAAQDLTTTWASNQINVTWCQWDSPRAAVIRDTVYIDGGALRVYPGLSDGSYGEFISDGNPYGLVYMLNFSTPFKTSANFSRVFTNMTKAGSGFANNIAPNFYDGAMLANDVEWFTYGGLVASTDSADAPDGNFVAKFMQYLSGPSRPFAPGWQTEKLPANITRYVSNGAAASVPSENLGYYFGGLRASDWGAIDNLPGNASTQSTTLIELNLAVQNQETWKNTTLPPNVAGRANAELVWVPVSAKGVLIAIGGVVDPSYATLIQQLNASETAESKRVSPGFMTTVSIYDIDKGVWYEQQTSGNTPGQLTQGCTVVASAQDGSSHNIYWYGGYDGISLTSSDSFNDDVWVLSVPSFIWTKVKSGEVRHARAGHRCVKPYPDQMIVIGGYTAPTGIVPKCVADGMVQIFNLSSAEWITSYDPTVWAEYSVPSTIYEKIGGAEKGGATVKQPAGGFNSSSLGTVFSTKYDASKITKWYPFKLAVPANSTTPILPQPTAKNNGTPAYLAPVLGVVLGLFFLTLIVLAILLFRRRKLLRSQSAAQSEAGTIENRRWIDNWLVGTPAVSSESKEAPTITTDEMPLSPDEDERPPQIFVQPSVPEMGEGQVHEMMDTSRPVELHDTGFIPLSSPNTEGLYASPSTASRSSTVSYASHNSSPINDPRPAISPFGSQFPSHSRSPSGGNDSMTEADYQRRIVSDLSNVSEMERGHLRGISETSVSTVGGGVASEGGYGTLATGTPPAGATIAPDLPYGPDYYAQVRDRQLSQSRDVGSEDGGSWEPGVDDQLQRPSQVSPISPPGEHEGDDYLGGAAQASGLTASPSMRTTSGGQAKRKSNFQESLD